MASQDATPLSSPLHQERQAKGAWTGSWRESTPKRQASTTIAERQAVLLSQRAPTPQPIYFCSLLFLVSCLETAVSRLFAFHQRAQVVCVSPPPRRALWLDQQDELQCLEWGERPLTKHTRLGQSSRAKSRVYQKTQVFPCGSWNSSPLRKLKYFEW